MTVVHTIPSTSHLMKTIWWTIKLTILRVTIPIEPSYHMSPLATSESNKNTHNVLLCDVSSNEAVCYIKYKVYYYRKPVRFVNIELSKQMCDMCLLIPEVAKNLDNIFCIFLLLFLISTHL